MKIVMSGSIFVESWMGNTDVFLRIERIAIEGAVISGKMRGMKEALFVFY